MTSSRGPGSSRAKRGICTLLLLAVAAAPALGQAHDSTRAPLFGKRDLWVAAAFVAGTAAMFPLDRQIARDLRDSALVTNRTLVEAAKVVGFLGSYGPFVIGGGMYVVGRATGRPRLAHLAVHGIESAIVGATATGVLKTVLGRARPHVAGHDNPRDFAFMRGIRSDSYQSFPSGHTTMSFSIASAVTLELNEWYPRSAWVVGPLLYGGATLVGLSRMYEDKHWASDVVLGAAVGTFAGLKTVRFTHTRAGNRIDRWLLGGDAPVQLDVLPGTDGSLRLAARTTW